MVEEVEKPKEQRHRWELPILFALLAVSFLLRLYIASGPPLHPDELHYAYDFASTDEFTSWANVRDVHCEFLIERRTAHPPVAMLVNRIFWYLPFHRFFDQPPLFFRVPQVLAGTAVVFLAWLYFAMVGERKRAMAAAFTTAFLPGMVMFSATTYLDSIYTVCLLGALIGFRWAKDKHLSAYLLPGAMVGLFAATKISAPVFMPFFLFLGITTAWTRDWARLALAFLYCLLGFLVIFLTLCDPFAYYHAIVSPSDGRYASEWQRSGPGGYLTLLFISIRWLLAVLVWEATPVLPLLFLAFVYTVFRKFMKREYYLLVGILFASPLIFMHLPQFSGTHGLFPIWCFLALSVSLLATTWRRVRVFAIVYTPIAFSCLLVSLTATYPFLPTRNIFHLDPSQELIESYVYRRDDPMAVLLDVNPAEVLAWKDSMRGAQLAETSWFYAATGSRTFTAEAQGMVDLIVQARDRDNQLGDGIDDDFSLVAETELFRVYRRTAGEKRVRFLGDELTFVKEAEGGRLFALPGSVHLYTGHLLLDGVSVERGSHYPASAYLLDARTAWSQLHSGYLYVPDDLSVPDVLEFTGPVRKDVFWQF